MAGGAEGQVRAGFGASWSGTPGTPGRVTAVTMHVPGPGGVHLGEPQGVCVVPAPETVPSATVSGGRGVGLRPGQRLGDPRATCLVSRLLPPSSLVGLSPPFLVPADAGEAPVSFASCASSVWWKVIIIVV